MMNPYDLQLIRTMHADRIHRIEQQRWTDGRSVRRMRRGRQED